MKKSLLILIFIICFLAAGTVGYAVDSLSYTPERTLRGDSEVMEYDANELTPDQYRKTYGAAQEDTVTHQVSFTVVDQHGSAVSGAALVIQSQTKGSTDENGRLTIALPNGTYSFQFKKLTHEYATGSFTVNDGNVSVPQVVMQARSQLRFTVTDGDVGIGDAQVTVGGQTITTGSGGLAVFWLSDGAYQYTVSHSSFDSSSGTVDVAGNTEYTVALSGGNRVEFNVTNDLGEAVSGATIAISGGTTLTTDQYGNARVWLSMGSYTYTITHSAVDTREGSFSVNDTLTQIGVEMSRKRFVAAFTVQDKDGKAIRDAKISIPEHVVYTNNNGKAQVKSLLPGSYEISVSKSGYKSYAGEFSIKNQTARVTVVLAKKSTPTPSPPPTVEPPTAPPPTPAPVPPTPTIRPTVRPTSGPVVSRTPRPSSSAKPTSSAKPSPSASPTPTSTPKKEPVIASTEPSTSPGPSASASATPTPTDTPDGLLSVGFNFVNGDGEPLADMLTELHSELLTGTTDVDGYIFYIDIPPGVHTLYLKEDQETVLAKVDFQLNYGEETNLERTEGNVADVTVKDDVNAITIDVVYDNSNLILAGVHQGWSQFYSELPGDAEKEAGAENSNIIFWLIVVIAVLLLVVIVLLAARRNMKNGKRNGKEKNGDYIQGGYR